MEKITNHKKWNVYKEHCGMSSIMYFVSMDGNKDDFNYVNDQERAMIVCKALNDGILV